MKVLLLPTNIASDLSHKTRALRSIGIEARGLALGGHPIQDAIGIEIFPLRPKRYITNQINRLRYLKRLRELMEWADILHWFWDFGTLPFRLDKLMVQRSGLPGVVQWGGSEIRVPEIDKEINPFYKEAFQQGYEYSWESRTRSYRTQRDFADVGFYPLEFIGMGHYMDRELFPERFRIWQSVVLSDHEPSIPDPDTNRPLIVHSPTAPVCKGTQHVMEAVELLKPEFDLEFRLVQGMPRPEALELMRSCDIYVDQLIIGMHGSAAVEAMAFGKPVICYINPTIGGEYPPDLPIVSANPDTIYVELKRLLVNGELRNTLGREGRKYVEKYHSDEKIAHELAAIYREVIARHLENRDA